MLDVNLFGAHWMARAAAAVMTRGGSIINVSSVLGPGLHPPAPGRVRASSKTGLLSLSRDLTAFLVFLASAASACNTGSTLTVDSGLTVSWDGAGGSYSEASRVLSVLSHGGVHGPQSLEGRPVVAEEPFFDGSLDRVPNTRQIHQRCAAHVGEGPCARGAQAVRPSMATGRRRGPRSTALARYGGGSSSRPENLTRRKSSGTATWSSMRARGAPKQ